MLILASKSPRRRQLLAEAGYRFEVRVPPFDDPPQPHVHGKEDARQLAADLAKAKVQSLIEALLIEESGANKAVAVQRSQPIVLLAADTICVDHHGQLLGQPADQADARTMIRTFTNQSHEVITGVALADLSNSPIESWCDVATVTLGHLTNEQLDTYLVSGDWQGKAGGYNLFDRQQAGWPLHVEGDPTAVVGLPMQKLSGRLASWGIMPEDIPA